jgi:Type II CAAX prenyl endopeptidase Rce1-like
LNHVVVFPDSIAVVMKKKTSKQPVVLPTQIMGSPGVSKHGYFGLSSRPLHILVFILPIIIVYEIGSTGLVGSGITSKLEAQDLLVRFFDLFGILGLHLPAIALIATFFIQHVLSKDSWRIVPVVPFAMIAESAFLTGPLVVLALVLEPQTSSLTQAMMIQDAGGGSAAAVGMSDGFLQGLFLAFGAGLYEEMLFRLVLITLLHFVVTDVLSFKDRTGKIVAVVLSACAFAWLHDSVYNASTGINFKLAIFYVIAGAYFGILFLARGFGIAVGAHLMYDLLVLVVIPGIQGQE